MVAKETINIAGVFIANGLMLLLAFALWALIYKIVPESNRDALMVVIGVLSSNFGQVVNWFFGSSSTQKKQADTIEKQASTIQAAQTALAPLTDSTVVPVAVGESVTVTGSDEAKP